MCIVDDTEIYVSLLSIYNNIGMVLRLLGKLYHIVEFSR